MKNFEKSLIIFISIGLLFNFNISANASLKSAIKINKNEKVEYLKENNTAYWDFMQIKMNDLSNFYLLAMFNYKY